MPKCSDCDREFSTDAALAQHMKDKHGVDGAAPASLARQDEEKRSDKKQKTLRKRNRHPVAIGVVVLAVVLGLGLYLVTAPSFVSLPVPCSTGETFIHVHPYLRIVIDGTNVTVPEGIGYLSQCPGGLAQIHTHDASGLIHVELSSTDANANYNLGDFFRLWAISPGLGTVSFNGTSHPVVFTNTDIFGYTADSTHKVQVLVDGKAVANPVGVSLEQLNYCYSGLPANAPPCYPTDSTSVGIGNPLWDGGTGYPYGTGHTIVVEYTTA